MEMKALLNQLEVGSAVAEFDNELERYFGRDTDLSGSRSGQSRRHRW
jgi:hypothetical protein